MFSDRTRNNSSNSTFINTQENLNGTRNLIQLDTQTSSQIINEEIVETMPTTKSISPIQPTLTTLTSTNNYTTHSETFYYSKIITDRLSNISTSNDIPKNK